MYNLYNHLKLKFLFLIYSLKSFIKRHQEELDQIEFGCSFSKEEFESKALNHSSIEALKTIVEDFLIKDVKVGIRWNKVARYDLEGDISPKSLSLQYYKPILDYLFSKNVNVTLNIGPIKVFRWPEEHLPRDLEKMDNLPPKKTQIREEAKILEISTIYLKRLLDKLISSYNSKDLANIKTIQIENECFNSFGHFAWTFPESYILNLMQIIATSMPEKNLLLSSSGLQNTKKIHSVFTKFLKNNPKFKKKLIVGINYYYKTPFNAKKLLLKHMDNLLIPSITGNNYSTLTKMLKNPKIDVEVSEAQMEGWGKNVTTPGKSYREFVFMLTRLKRTILRSKGSLVRIWGIEGLAKSSLEGELTFDQKRILDTIKKVNVV